MKTLAIVGISIVCVALIILLIAYLSTSKERLNKKFFTAVRDNDITAVTNLLKGKQINVANYKDINSYTPLSVAAENGNIEMARLLLDNNADVNSTAGPRKFSNLMFAAAKGQAEMVEFLLEQGANVNAVADSSSDTRFTSGVTALMMAVTSGNSQAVNYLLDQGADVNATGAWEITTSRDINVQQAVTSARMAGMDMQEMVEDVTAQLLKKYPPESFFKPPLLSAIEIGNNELVEILLERGADPNWIYIAKGSDWAWPLVPGMNPLMYAAYRGEVKAMELLISKGLGVNAKDNAQQTALMYAAHGGKAEAVRLLAGKGADLNARDVDNQNALWYAIYAGSTEAVKALVDLGAEQTKVKGGKTALMWAVELGKKDIAEVLIESGADINAEIPSGGTPLMFAAADGQLETVKFLVSLGASVNQKEKDGSTALSYAARAGSPEIIKFLVEQGASVTNSADIDVPDKNGLTALMLASMEGQTATVKLLCEKGANVNAGDKERITALMRAAWFGFPEVVKLLIENGADVNASSEIGEKAISWAMLKGQFVMDPEKVKAHVENITDFTDQQKAESAAELVSLIGTRAEMYMNGEADVYKTVGEEKIAAYVEIITILQEAGAR
jgi:ankyrin repeat protein